MLWYAVSQGGLQGLLPAQRGRGMCLLQGPPSQIPQCLRGGAVALEAAGSVLVPTFPAPRPGEAVFLTRGHTVARPRRIRGQSRKVMGADVGDRGQPLLRVLREQAPNKGWPRPLLPVPSSPPGEHGAQNIPAPARLGGRACLHRGPQPGLWGPRAGHLRGACWTKGPGGHAHAVLLDRPLCWRDPAGCPAAPSGTGRGQGWWERMELQLLRVPQGPKGGIRGHGEGSHHSHQSLPPSPSPSLGRDQDWATGTQTEGFQEEGGSPGHAGPREEPRPPGSWSSHLSTLGWGWGLWASVSPPGQWAWGLQGWELLLF